MKISRPVSGRILTHAEGMGTPSADTVRQRARELAQIDSRPAPSELDWKRAFLELHDLPESDSLGEELISEGLAEADHDLMLAARKMKN